MWSRWTEKARAAVWAAQGMAEAQGRSEPTPEQLLFALLSDEESVACRLLALLKVETNALRGHVLPAMPESNEIAMTTSGQPEGHAMKGVVDGAYAAARDLNTNYVGTEHLLLALLRCSDSIRALLELEGVAESGIRQAWQDLPREAQPTQPALQSDGCSPCGTRT